MAPAEGLSAPGVAHYDSNTMTVGDGTWDFDKNTFLLPNLVGFNFDTMRYNGMANRFSTVDQYHTIILAHGVIGAIVFLFLVPAAVMSARFYVGRPGFAIRYHLMIQIFNVLLLTTVFILGWFAVGPERSWTNPHHAIGLAVYVMFLLQIIGGRIVRNIQGRSLRIAIHQWSGRLIALLGIIQVPLGLTLYGSPKYLFALFSVWMAFLLLLYFILDFRSGGTRRSHGHHHPDDPFVSGGAGGGGGPGSAFQAENDQGRFGWKRWIMPILAGGALWTFLRRRKRNKEEEEDDEFSRSRSRSPSGRTRTDITPSRRGSASGYMDTEKYSDMSDSRRDDDKGRSGLMKGLLGVGAAIGAGGLIHNMMNKRKKNKYADEYSAVSTETPRRDRYGYSNRPPPPPGAQSEYSDYTIDTRREPGARGSTLPPPGNPAMAAQAMSAADERYGYGNRPMTPPRASHARTRPGYGGGGMDDSDLSSYASPSRRHGDEPGSGGRGSWGKGILAGMGMGWLGKKFADRKGGRGDGRRLRDEEDQRSGMLGSRYTGDGYSSPSRSGRHARRPSDRRRPHPASTLGTSLTGGMTEDDSSRLEPRPETSGHGGPPMPPYGAGAARGGGDGGRRQSESRRRNVSDPIDMPPMPADSYGDYASDSYFSPTGPPPQRQGSSRRKRDGERAAAEAAASAGALAAEEEASRLTDSRVGGGRDRRGGGGGGDPVSVKVKVHDDKDRNVTLRRLTDEEAAASRRDQGGGRHRRNDSMSSVSGMGPGGGGGGGGGATDYYSSPTSNRRRYRRDSSQQRRAEMAAESAVDPSSAAGPATSTLPPLSPPNPAFAKGRKPKDSAYYSGQSGPPPHTPIGSGQDISSVGSPDSHGTWSAMSPSPAGGAGAEKPTGSAADNRRRRRLERRRSNSSRPTGTDMFD